MDKILTLNQSIFGTKTIERRNSKRALKASVQELYIPQESEEITYDEGYDIDGGGSITLTLSIGCTIGGFVQGGIMGAISGLVTAAITSAIGVATGGWGFLIGGAVAWLVNNLLGTFISDIINDACAGGGFSISKTFTLAEGFFVPTLKFSLGFDLGEIIGGSLGGGFTSGLGGQAVVTPQYA